MKTRHPWLHGLRIVLSVLGVQAFTQAFAAGMAPWHVVALVMTSPFFVLIGAAVLLRERVAANRWLAAVIGFAGAMILLRPWEGAVTVADALSGGGGDLLGWGFADHQAPDRDRAANRDHHVAFAAADADQRAVFACMQGLRFHSGSILGLLILGGAIMYAAQHFLTLAYASCRCGVCAAV